MGKTIRTPGRRGTRRSKRRFLALGVVMIGRVERRFAFLGTKRIERRSRHKHSAQHQGTGAVTRREIRNSSHGGDAGIPPCSIKQEWQKKHTKGVRYSMIVS